MDLRRYGNRPLRHGVNGGTGRNPRQEDDSLHFLSQEEKECLRFFEDTIGSLEASLEENDLRQTSTTPVNAGRAMEEVDGPLTSSPTQLSIMASPLARPLSPKDQDIIDLVRPELDMAQPREPMFNPTNPDFQSMLSTPSSHFEIKPKRDSTVSFPSEYNSLMPSGNYGSTDSHYHPPGSVPTPVLIAQKIAESQAGGASSIDPSTLLRRCNQESETKSSLSTDSTLKQGPPPFARTNRFPVSVNMLLGNKDLQHPPQSNLSIQERRGQTNLTGSQPLLQDVSQQNKETTLNKIPRRSISFKDPSPDKSRMEALSKLGLTRNRAMSGGQSLLSPDPYLDPFTHGKTRAEPVVASVSPVSETSVNLPEANVANVPQVTSVANVTNVADVTNAPNVANPTHVASASNVGNSGLVTNVASLANVANVANAPKITNVTNATNVANMDNVANASNITNMGNVTSVAITPNIAKMGNVASVSNTLNITSFANSPNIANVGNTASVADPANLATPTLSQISVDRRPEAPQTSPLSGNETRNLQRSPSPPGATQSLAFPPPLEKEAPGYPLPPPPPPPEVSSLEFNSYGGKSLMVNPSCTSKSEPATSPVTQEPRILSSALANPSQFNSFGGKSKVVTPVPVVVNQSDLPDILSSHLDKSQTLPSKSQLPSAELNSYGGKSRTINPSSGVSRPLSTPGRTLKAPAPAPAPKPSRHSYHGTTLPPKTAATALSPERKPRSGSLFRPQSITVQFSGRSGSEELRRDALRKLGLLKDS
ncbi:uncharacterized protein [Antennarius striatus]|uniref:uncharacterized protein n=1 Tax=Antennarius striatus TaxID=241820 RepID=UPI0035B1D6B0